MSPRDWRGWAPPRSACSTRATSSTSPSTCSKRSPATATRSFAPWPTASTAPTPRAPGAVYPTLQMLEDMGYVSATRQDGRKVYALTASGRQFLAEQRDVVDHVCARLSGWKGVDEGDEQHRIRHELWELGHLLGRRGHWRRSSPTRSRAFAR